MSRWKFILLAFAVVGLVCLREARADDEADRNADRVLSRTVWYVGTIGPKLHVQIELTVHPAAAGQDQQITGSYFDEGIGKPLDLSGTAQLIPDSDKGYQVSIDERLWHTLKSGTFTGTLNIDKDQASLVWSTPEGDRTLPVALVRVAQESCLSLAQGTRSTVCFRRPQFVGDGALTKLADEQLRKEAAKEFADNVHDAQEDWADLQNRASFWGDYDTAINMTYFSGALIVLRANSYFAEGSTAHGDNVAGHNFVLRDGRLHDLELKDLFNPGSAYLKVLSDGCIERLRAKQAEFVMDGTVTHLDADELNAFSVGPQGITFLFSAYAVGPWPQGTMDVTLSWKSLAGILADVPEIRQWTKPA